MAEITQQTALVIEVRDITSLTDTEKTAIRRAVVRSNGLNIVIKGAGVETLKVIAVHVDDGEYAVGNECSIGLYSINEHEMLLHSVGDITADDLKDEIFED